MDLHERLMRTARRELLSQISITDRLIKQLYRRAAKAIEQQIAAAKAGSLTERWLTAYKAELDKEIQRLGEGVYTATVNGARRAAEARVECEQEYLRQVAAQAGVDDSFVSTLSSVPTEALRAMMDGRLYTDGRMLSQRIWSATGRLEGNIAEILQQGVAQQLDALTLAKQLEAYVNPSAACPVSWHTLYPDIPFDRKVDYNALRLARTAITHAHWAAEKAAAKKNPLCQGLKWNLSNSHYERQIEHWGEDVCDGYARHDEGLGEGVWPIDKLPLPHPQCLCYRTEALPPMDEAVEILSSWADLTDDERHLRAWAKGEAKDEALEKDYQRWREEKLQAQRRENVQSALDKSLDFATMDTDSIAIPHSLGAKALNYDVKLPDGTYAQLTEGTRITNVKIIAGSGRERQIDMIQALLDRYPGTSETAWTKRKGIGYIDYLGESYKAELHWYEEPSVGRVEFKIKTKNGAWFIDDEY